jgi:dynein heavy chain
MDCPRVRYPSFNDAVEAHLAAAGYQVLTSAGDQVDKVVQLYEILMTRHTVMVVGQTGGGKSVILNTLAQAQTAMGRRTTLHVLNPKAITVAELYGVLDKDTRDWTDGLLSNMFRCALQPAAGHQRSGCACRAAVTFCRHVSGCTATLHLCLQGGQPAAAVRAGRGSVPRF